MCPARVAKPWIEQADELQNRILMQVAWRRCHDELAVNELVAVSVVWERSN